MSNRFPPFRPCRPGAASVSSILPMKTPGIIAEQVDLSPLTTMRLGGPARYLARCTTPDEIRTALEWAAVQGLPVQVLGGGSNTLFDDRGYPGLVLKLELSGVRFEGGGKVEVSALAGEDWDDLVRRCIARGLSGIECLSGIPGLVGAAPMQNVGAYGQEVAGTIAAVRAIDRATLKEVEFANRECGFRYRNSRFKNEDRDRYVITEVVFRLEARSPAGAALPRVERARRPPRRPRRSRAGGARLVRGEGGRSRAAAEQVDGDRPRRPQHPLGRLVLSQPRSQRGRALRTAPPLRGSTR